MRLTGDQLIAAPPDRVWEALIDPDFLGPLIPGCRSMSGNPASGYDVAAERSVGGVDVRMTGRIDLSDIRPGEGVLLHASGEAGGFGGAKGTARIVLRPEAAGTRLGWDLDAQTEGRLASFPRIVVEAVASRVASGFVERFAAAIEGREVKKGWLSRLTGR